jgi:hypothetical protein
MRKAVSCILGVLSKDTFGSPVLAPFALAPTRIRTKCHSVFFGERLSGKAGVAKFAY